MSKLLKPNDAIKAVYEDKFQLFLEANEDNIEKNKPLVFYVNDSTGKCICKMNNYFNEK